MNKAIGGPAPLTPPNCDLRDFAFMPLDVARLRDSDLAALESPEACWAAVLLWSASWHQVPAASLPDDNRILSQLAGYGRVVKEWERVREGALRGWIKCSDGRLYHPVVAEKALDSWKAKALHHWKKECDRIRKANKQREMEHKPLLQFPPEPCFENHSFPKDSERIPTERKGIPAEMTTDSGGKDESGDGIPAENALKGEGQGEGQGQGEFKNKETLSFASTVVAAEKPPESEKSIPQRHVQIAVLLRSQGITPFTPVHPLAMQWAENPAITDAILKGAVDMARQSKGEGVPISPNYLRPIVEQLLTAPPPSEARLKPPVDTWWTSDAGIDRKGRELGMRPNGTESYPSFKDRIFDELRKREGGKAA